MKYKKWFLLIIAILFISTAVLGYKVYTDKHNIVRLVKANDLVFVATYETVPNEEVKAEFGEVEKTIKRSQVPNGNYESNSLEKGTRLYKHEKGNEFPRSIVFKEEGKYYLASEAGSNDNKK